MCKVCKECEPKDKESDNREKRRVRGTTNEKK
jgi:hypothetical protein